MLLYFGTLVAMELHLRYPGFAQALRDCGYLDTCMKKQTSVQRNMAEHALVPI